MYYSIDDGTGTQAGTGIREYRVARAAAQALADERGESVLLYASDGSDGETVEPAAPTPAGDHIALLEVAARAQADASFAARAHAAASQAAVCAERYGDDDARKLAAISRETFTAWVDADHALAIADRDYRNALVRSDARAADC